MTNNSETPASSDPIVIRAMIVTDNTGSSPKSTSRTHDTVSLAADFCKAIAWPLLALIFFLTFQDAIRRTIAVIPNKLEQADKANIGSLSWEIQQSARYTGGADLAVRVGNLSPAAIEALINAPRHGTGAGVLAGYSGAANERGYVIPPQHRLDGLLELEAAQLVKFREPLRQWLQFIQSLPLRADLSVRFAHGRTMILTSPLAADQQHRINMQSYELTLKGEQAVEAILKAIGEQLQAK